jgi:hypothetical protein
LREIAGETRFSKGTEPGASFPSRQEILSRRKNDKRRRRGFSPHGGQERHHIPLTPEGVPAAVPDATPTSGVVFVSDEARAQYPWLPGRVIAWSVWRGPGHLRVQIDERGDAVALGARPVLARAS